jgi:hypothetical protein
MAAMVAVKLPCARCGQETYDDPGWTRVGRRRYCRDCGRIRSLELTVRHLRIVVLGLAALCLVLFWWAV